MNERTPDVVTVAVTRIDGGLTVIRVVTTEYRPATDDEKAAGMGTRVPNWTIEPTPEYINSIIAKYNWTDGFAPASWRIVPNDFVDATTDRTYRDAWKDSGETRPSHNMAKAREIHRFKLRKMRARALDNLDNEYMKALETDDKQEMKRIVFEKQRLRDLPADPRIEAAQTIDELKTVIV